MAAMPATFVIDPPPAPVADTGVAMMRSQENFTAATSNAAACRAEARIHDDLIAFPSLARRCGAYVWRRSVSHSNDDRGSSGARGRRRPHEDGELRDRPPDSAASAIDTSVRSPPS